MIPLAVQKRRRRFGYTFFAYAILWTVLVMKLTPTFLRLLGKMSVVGLCFPFAMPIGIYPFMAYFQMKERRFKKAVKAAHYMLCTNCLYNLEGHESIGICPECGTPFTARKLEADWKEFTDPDRSFWRFS